VFDGCLRILDAFEFAQNSLSSEHRVGGNVRCVISLLCGM
jgi:hypothetical protein